MPRRIQKSELNYFPVNLFYSIWYLSAICLIGNLVLTSSAGAQPLPSVDIFLVGLSDGRIDTTAFKLKNITHRDGYDNQPAFTKDGSALIYSSDKSGKSNDLYRYLIDRGEKRRKKGINLQMSYSDVGEYSPRPLSTRGYSALIVEADGKQRIWKLSTDMLTGKPVLPKMTNVAYYAWIDEERVAVLLLTDPLTLEIANIDTGAHKRVASNIGRSIARIPGSTDISFVQKKEQGTWMIRKINPDTHKISDVAPTFGDGEDYVWTPEGKLLMASGISIYEWVRASRKWEKMHTFAGVGLGSITRMAVSPKNDLLAFVADQKR